MRHLCNSHIRKRGVAKKLNRLSGGRRDRLVPLGLPVLTPSKGPNAPLGFSFRAGFRFSEQLTFVPEIGPILLANWSSWSVLDGAASDWSPGALTLGPAEQPDPATQGGFANSIGSFSGIQPSLRQLATSRPGVGGQQRRPTASRALIATTRLYRFASGRINRVYLNRFDLAATHLIEIG